MNTRPSNATSIPAPPSPAPGRYSPPKPRSGAPIDLWLDANEGQCPLVDLGSIASRIAADARRYPIARPLEEAIAANLGVTPEQVLVTAGADEAIDRACRSFLGPKCEIIVPSPTFEMIVRYARLAGATVTQIPWEDEPFPLNQVQAALGDQTAMVAVVSPNNPTGAVVTPEELRKLSESTPDAILMVDLAYAEFAENDLTSLALSLPNAIVFRTFSKAHGLAGLRVGYAAGPANLIDRMRSAGSPYPVSALSLAAAQASLALAPVRIPEVVSRCRKERTTLIDLLVALGASVRPSQGNFVLARFANAEWVWEALASLGISARRFPSGGTLDNALRITCPGEPASFDRLSRALRSILKPEALLFDMDGVLADVSQSYRAAIQATAMEFGVRLTPADISAAKAAGNANNDWDLTLRLVQNAGVSASFDEVKSNLERLYQGTQSTPGLREHESLIPSRRLLERLAASLPLAIVTGRPRSDCNTFLARFNLQNIFSAQVCMEDAPAKPSAAPIRLALEALGVQTAWMVGDTPDDIVSARAAGVVPLGFVPPGEAFRSIGSALQRAGAAALLETLDQLEDLLP